jgi:hypothetical protein
MNDFDVNVLRSLRDPARSARLAERICASLGQAPRALPSRLSLAVEFMTWRVGIAAAAIIIVATTAAVFTQEAPANAGDPIIGAALAGDLPRAQDVYAWMAGMTAEGGR